MVKLRLRRTGTRNKACFRIVATDQRSPRDGRFIEILGYYDPRHEDEEIDLERADYWLSNGAQASETVASIIDRARKGTGALKAEKKKPEEKKPEEKVAEVKAEEKVEEKTEEAVAEVVTEDAPAEVKAEEVVVEKPAEAAPTEEPAKKSE